jgi:uncharacterized membrane protein YciS (DUF1049 family)
MTTLQAVYFGLGVLAGWCLHAAFSAYRNIREYQKLVREERAMEREILGDDFGERIEALRGEP